MACALAAHAEINAKTRDAQRMSHEDKEDSMSQREKLVDAKRFPGVTKERRE